MAAAVGAAAISGAYFMSRDASPESSQGSGAAGDEGAGTETGATTDSGVASAATTAAEDMIAEPDAGRLVRITVESRPAGAAVKTAGGRLLCRPTPCSFEEMSGSQITLQVGRGNYAGMRRLTVDRDMELILPLRRVSAASTKRASTPDTGREGQTTKGRRPGRDAGQRLPLGEGLKAFPVTDPR